MSMPFPLLIRASLLVILAATQTPLSRASQDDYREAVGYHRLARELGNNLPDGRTVSIAHVEWMADGAYAPNTEDGEFAGIEFQYTGPGRESNSHATAVGKFLYGRGASMTPAVPAVTLWPAQVFLEAPDGMLRPGSGEEPATAKHDVQNHSWVYNPNEPGMDLRLLRRFDFLLDRDNVFAVACTRPGENHEVDALLASSYNALVAGVSSGRNTSKTTRVDGEGRIKPEIVAPMKEPSAAGPVVASAAALLIDSIHANPTRDEASRIPCLKAILLAGATKEEFPEWSHSEETPLDATFGAGELNVYNSYQILQGGPAKPGKGSTAPATGWDWNTPSKGSQLYFFEVGEEAVFSAVLCWNRTVVDGIAGMGAWGEPQSLLVGMSLRLYDATGASVGKLLEASESPVDNVQHVYLPSLPPGRYALEVAADLRTVGYGLAWQAR